MVVAERLFCVFVFILILKGYCSAEEMVAENGGLFLVVMCLYLLTS